MKCSNNDISSFYSGWIDLFGWGTSGYDHGAVCYQPWSISQIGSDYWAYGTSNADLNDQTGQADWGYNAIINGGGIENQWHSLTIEEWNYILYTRSTLSGIRFVKAIVNNVNGLILLPDEWSSSIFPLNNINQPDASFGNNIISVSLWSILNMNGAVFLPTAGKRISTLFSGGGNAGYYWSATGGGSNHAPWMQVSTSGVHALSNIANFRYEGYAVRLVCPVE